MSSEKGQSSAPSASRCYTLLPLKWKKSKPCSYRQRFEAHTPFGNFFVERYREDWEDDKPWDSWKWGYCFDEYYDEHLSECQSAEEGKRLAQDEWNRRILPCLKECDNPETGGRLTMSKTPDSVARCSSHCSDAKSIGEVLQDGYRLVDDLRAVEVTLDGLARDYVAGTRMGVWKSLHCLEVAKAMIEKR